MHQLRTVNCEDPKPKKNNKAPETAKPINHCPMPSSAEPAPLLGESCEKQHMSSKAVSSGSAVIKPCRTVGSDPCLCKASPSGSNKRGSVIIQHLDPERDSFARFCWKQLEGARAYLPKGPKVVPFGGSYLEFHKVLWLRFLPFRLYPKAPK